jgi:hypothetical protein
VGALVDAHVDAGNRLAGARHERVGELLRLADEREDRAVVVGVGMDVEDARAGVPERAAYRFNGLLPPPVADVWDRFEQSRLIICAERHAGRALGHSCYSSSPTSANAALRFV